MALVAVCLAMAVTMASAAPRVVECGTGDGGSYRNLTARGVDCAQARSVATLILHDVSPCWRTERSLGSCRYRRGAWAVKGRWFRDRYRNGQLDLRATASRGRVVRLQTDWDGE